MKWQLICSCWLLPTPLTGGGGVRKGSVITRICPDWFICCGEVEQELNSSLLIKHAETGQFIGVFSSVIQA